MTMSRAIGRGSCTDMAAAGPAIVRKAGAIPPHANDGIPDALDTGDVLDLALLGLAAEPRQQRLTVERAAGLLRRLGGPLLSPTLDVVTGRARRLLEAGYVEAVRDPAAPPSGLRSDVCAGPAQLRLRLTPAGAQRLRDLLLAPEPEGAPQADLAFALKLCLMDRLDRAGRTRLLEQAIAIKERDRAAADYAARHCGASSPYTRLWLERQTARLADDIAWLQSLPVK
jgi:Putative AphA-like transcriptional regulator